MSSRSFRSVFMVASCAGAALCCYLVSLRVASERAALEDVETRIVLAQQDMRVLQTEIGTRGRLSQLERWNAGAFALSAPSADQFLKGGFELARLAQPERKIDFQAPVVLASAPAPAPHRQPVGEPETGEVPARFVGQLPQTTDTATDKPVTAAKPAPTRSVEKPGLAAAQYSARKAPANAAQKQAKKSVDKPVVASTKPVTKPVRLAKADPLAPLPAKHSGNSKDFSAER